MNGWRAELSFGEWAGQSSHLVNGWGVELSFGEWAEVRVFSGE